MSEIEKRIIQMQFDNSQFERRVQTTIKTLDDLKKASDLKGAAQGFEELQKAADSFSLAKIASGVETLEKRFSTFGIVGMRVIQNVTDSLMGLVKKANNFVIGGILTGGKNRAFNLENAHFQLLGLLKDEQAVADVMKNVSDSVDGTAYSLDAAASVASQLAASGMRAGDQMFSSLRAVAGVAAMTNSEYSDIGRIFTQVAGQGKVMGDQLLQLSGRGMNAAATLAQYLTKVGNGAEVTEAQVREMVTKGQIDFATFAAAMDDAFGEHAKKANETFTGALSNIKAALGRIGAMFYSPLIEQNGALVKLFNAVRVKINDIKTALEPVADVTTKKLIKMIEYITDKIEKFDMSKPIAAIKNFSTYIGNSIKSISQLFTSIFRNTPWDNLYSKLKKAGITADDFKNKLLEIGKAGDGARFTELEKMFNFFGSMRNVFNSGKLKKNEVIETLQKLAEDADKAARAIDVTTENLEHFQKMSVDVIKGNWGNGEERIRRLNEAGENQVVIQKLVNKIWERNGQTWDDCTISADELQNVINNLSDADLENIGYTRDQVEILKDLAKQAAETGTPISELLEKMKKPTVSQLFFNSIYNILDSVRTIAGSVKEAFTSIFKPIKVGPESLYKLAETVFAFTERLKVSGGVGKQITSVFKGLFTILKLIGSAFVSVSKVGLTLFGSFLTIAVKGLLSFGSIIGDIVSSLGKWTEKNTIFKKGLEKVTSIIKELTKAVGKQIDKFNEWAVNTKFVSAFTDKIKKYVNDIRNVFELLYSKISGNSKIQKILSDIQNGLYDFLAKIPGRVISFTKTIVDCSKSIYDAISSWIDELLTLPETQAALEKIQDIFSKIKELLKKAFDNGKNNLESFIDAIKNLRNISLDDILTQIKKIPENISRLFNDADTSIESVQSRLNTMGDNTKSVFGRIGGYFEGGKNVLSNFVEFVKNKLSEISFGKLFSIVLTGGIYSTLKDLNKTLSVFASPLKGISSVTKSLSGLFDEMKAAVKQKRQINMFKEIATGVAILAGSVALLAVLPFNKVKNAAVILALLSGIVVTIGVILDTVGSFKNISSSNMLTLGSVVGSLVSIAGSIWLLAKAMEKLTAIDWTNINNVLSLGVFIVFGTFLTLIDRLSGYGGTKATKLHIGGLLTSAISILVLSKAIEQITSLNITKNTVIKLGFVLGVITLLSNIPGTVSKKGSIFSGNGLGLLSMAVSVQVLISSLKKIENIDTGKLTKNAGALVYVFGILTALSLDARLAGSRAGTAGLGIMAMAGSLVIIAQAMNLIADMDYATIENGIQFVAGIFSSFALVLYSSKFVGENAGKIGGAAIKMAGAIAIIAASVVVLGMIDANDLSKAERVIVTIGGVLGTLLAVGKFASNSKVSGTIMALSIAIAGLGGIMIALSMIDENSLAGAEKAIWAIGVVLGALLVISGTISPTKLGNFIGVLASTTIAIGLISIMLYALSKIDPKSNLQNATALSEILLAISAAMLILQGIPAVGALKAVGSLAIIVGGTGGIVWLAGLLAGLSGVKPAMERGAEAIGLIGKAIGNFVGGLSAGILSGLPDIGLYLSDFMTNARGFIDNIKLINGETLTGIKNLAEMVLMLSAASFLDGLSAILSGGWLTGKNSGIAAFGETLSDFGISLLEYSFAVEGVNKQAIDNSVEASKSLVSLLETIPKIGGLVGAIFGNKEWSTLTTGLVEFGTALRNFSISAVGVNVPAIQNAAEGGKALSELLSNVESTNGLLQVIVGNKEWSTLTTGLVEFGTGLRDFSVSVFGVNVESIRNSVEAGKALSELLSSIEPTSGLVQKIFGGKQWSTLASGLTTFGTSLTNYSNITASLNLVAVGNSVRAVDSIKMALTNVDSLNSKTVNDVCLSITTIGTSLNAYWQYVSAIDTEQMGLVSVKLRELASTVSYINNVPYDNLEGFGDAIKRFAKSGITKFINFTSEDQTAITEFGKNIVRAMVNGVLSMKSSSDATAKSVIVSFMNTIRNQINYSKAGLVSTMVTTLSTMCLRGATAVRSYSNAYLNAGRTVGTSLVNGLRSSITGVSSVFVVACARAAQTIRNYYGSFYSAGSYVASGFANGITANTYTAQARAAAMAEAAVRSAKSALGIHSPSKVFYSIGNFAGLGFVNALKYWSEKSSTAGKALGESATDGLRSTAELLASLSMMDVDDELTITPVVDLSQVNNGLSMMDSMLYNRGINLLPFTSARLVNGMPMNNQNGITNTSNSDNTSKVVASIDHLTSRVDKLGAQMTKMQVVLDTGATVGALTPAIDRRLGQIESYKERGI